MSSNSRLGRRSRALPIALSLGLLAAGSSALTVAAPHAADAAASAPVRADAFPAPAPVFTEQFEDGLTPTTFTTLDKYPSGGPFRYTASPEWLRFVQCNGVILSPSVLEPSDPLNPDCGAQGWTSLQNLAKALGKVAGESDAVALNNHAVSAWTNGNGTFADTTQTTELQTLSAIPVANANHFYTFSVDAAATTCDGGHAEPALDFFLLNANDPAQATAVNNAALNPCGLHVDVPIPTSLRDEVHAGTLTADHAMLFPGTSLGILVTNETTSNNGNDGAFDNLRVLDVTPQLSKAFSPAVVRSNQTSTLTFTVTNTSDLGEKDGWSFTDTLPSGVAVAANPNIGGTCTLVSSTAPVGAGAVTFKANLPAGDSCTLTVDVTAPAGSYTNDANNLKDPAGSDTEVGLLPPTSPATLTVANPDLAITNEGTPDPVAPGGPVQWTLKVTNIGPSASTGSTITDTLPPGVVPDPTSLGACSFTAPVVTCPAGALAAGSSASFTFTTPAPTTPGPLATQAKVTGADPDPNPANNEADKTVTVATPDVSVQMSGPQRVPPGEPVDWTIIVRNSGPGPVTNVGVHDAVPPGVTGLHLDPGVPGCAIDAPTNTLDCTLASIPDGGSVVIHLTGIATDAAGPLLTNMVTITSAVDGDPSDNSASVATRIANSGPQQPDRPNAGPRHGGGGGGDDCRRHRHHDHGRGDWTDFTDGNGNRC